MLTAPSHCGILATMGGAHPTENGCETEEWLRLGMV